MRKFMKRNNYYVSKKQKIDLVMKQKNNKEYKKIMKTGEIMYT